MAPAGELEITGRDFECKGLLREKLKRQSKEGGLWLNCYPCLVGIAGEAEQGSGPHQTVKMSARCPCNLHLFPSNQGKPQTALQHLKRAFQVDFQCFPALSHTAAVFHELGETDAELQAMDLLYKVCQLPVVLG